MGKESWDGLDWLAGGLHLFNEGSGDKVIAKLKGGAGIWHIESAHETDESGGDWEDSSPSFSQ